MGVKDPVLVIGDVRWDMLPSGERLGGWGAAFACRLASLGHAVTFAGCVGLDALGDRAVQELKLLGVGTDLVQRDPSLPTGTASIERTEGGRFTYASFNHAAVTQLSEHADLMGRTDDFEVLYCNSYIHTSLVAGATLQTFLNRCGPSFKIYDVRCEARSVTVEALQAALQVSSVFRVSAEDVPTICQLLGLPVLEPELFCGAITERFGVSYCLVMDPFQGAVVSSILGEQISIAPHLSKVVDLLGWHEAFLAGFVHHVQKGSSLERCAIAGVHYADLVAATHGAMQPCPQSELEKVKAA
jgi:fructokinase